MYYIFIQDNKLSGCGQCKLLNKNAYNAEVTEGLYNDYIENPLKYIAGEKEIEVDVPDFDTITEEYEDENGETQTREVQVPVMVEVTETVFVYDENGEQTGEEEQTKQVQQTHKETVTIPYPVLNPNYEQDRAAKERERIGNLQVTKRVFALALQQLGISYSQLKERIASNEQAQLEWDLCVELQRKNPLLDVMAAKLEVTSETLDNIFKAANGEAIE